MNDLPLQSAHSQIHSTSRLPLRGATPTLLLTTQESEYREMDQAFRASGGIAESGEVTALLRRRTDQPISVLARWIVDREVLNFRWRSRVMLPLFQFDLPTVTLRQPVVDVLWELAPALSDWEIALWFARRNPWLDNAPPVDAINVDQRAVYEAARADRYLIQG